MQRAAERDISIIGRIDFRNDRRRFGIKQADRLFHLYILGKTGTGKTTFLETLARQDIQAGRGMALIDPHGDLVARLAATVPPERRDDLLYLDAPDPHQPFGYNPLKRVHPNAIALAASGLMEAFKKHWTDAWGVRMEHVLRQSLFALLEYGDATLADVLRLLTDKGYRKTVAGRITNEPVRRFWLAEFEQYSFRYRADAIAPI